MKKTNIFIAVGLLLCLLLASCSSLGHQHSYSVDWSVDEIYHWHKATCEHTDEVSSRELHRFVKDGISDDGKYNVKCIDCGYKTQQLASVDEGLVYELLEDGSGYRVLGINDKLKGESDIMIPSLHDGKPVVEIAESAFSNNNDIKNIIISEGVQKIGYYAFANCENLDNIAIPDSVNELGIDVFLGCTKLLAEENEENGIIYIDKWVISCKQATTFVTLREGTVGIAPRAFAYCSNMVSINIPESLSVIGEYAFYKCTNLVSVDIPSGVKEIGDYAFYSCTNLANVFLENELEEIGLSAFRKCTNMSMITYNGTKAEWDAIDKAYDWDYDTMDLSYKRQYTVSCTDGTIEK